MRKVAIVGIGKTRVDELWGKSLREIAGEAIFSALQDANYSKVDGIFVGNMLSGILNELENLATLIADWAGLVGIEAVKIEAACGSGAAAVHMGVLAVGSGYMDYAIAMGVEKMSDNPHCRDHKSFGDRSRCGLGILAGAVFRCAECPDYASIYA
jgi:acetyl-CoA C-acetyltransferase